MIGAGSCPGRDSIALSEIVGTSERRDVVDVELPPAVGFLLDALRRAIERCAIKPIVRLAGGGLAPLCGLLPHLSYLGRRGVVPPGAVKDRLDAGAGEAPFAVEPGAEVGGASVAVGPGLVEARSAVGDCLACREGRGGDRQL